MTASICSGMLEDIRDLVEGLVVNDSWEIGNGGGERKRAVEDHLRDERETGEATKMIMMEEVESSRRLEKANRLMEVEMLTEILEGLSKIDWSMMTWRRPRDCRRMM